MGTEGEWERTKRETASVNPRFASGRRLTNGPSLAKSRTNPNTILADPILNRRERTRGKILATVLRRKGSQERRSSRSEPVSVARKGGGAEPGRHGHLFFRGPPELSATAKRCRTFRRRTLQAGSRPGRPRRTDAAEHPRLSDRPFRNAPAGRHCRTHQSAVRGTRTPASTKRLRGGIGCRAGPALLKTGKGAQTNPGASHCVYERR